MIMAVNGKFGETSSRRSVHAGGSRRRAAVALALAGVFGLLLVLPACGKQETVQLSFSGRCKSSQGAGIPEFSLSVSRPSTLGMPSSVMVKAVDGNYQASLIVRGTADQDAGVLGPTSEKVKIEVAANGFQTKVFNVTANQLFVGKPNVLNVTLEPNA